jgi:Ca-activated chloride channel homolog
MSQPAETLKSYLLKRNAVCSLPRVLAVLLLIVLIETIPQVVASAQTPASDDEVIRVSTDLLLFPIRIRDKGGKSVTGLTDRDLSLKDEDRATSALHFSPGGDRVALIFALDQSGSVRQIVLQQRDAALGLFGRFSDRSRIAVVRFAETPTLVAPFDRNIEAARKAFDFSVSNQHTAIFDAAAMAVKTFKTWDRGERRIVILISDGLDNASRIKPNQVIEDAVRNYISFYVIHLPLFEPFDGHLAVRQPAKGFRELAEKTGGKYFLAADVKAALEPSKSVDLMPIFQAIEEDLRSQYLLGFYVSESARDGRRHRFSVSLLPDGLEYSVGARGYSRTHQFFVNMLPDKNSN